jgi:hypothetical protein
MPRRTAIRILSAVAATASIVTANAGATASATRCSAQTSDDPTTKVVTAFYGRCSRGGTFFTVGQGSLLGRVGGYSTSFVGSSSLLSGRIGSYRTSYTMLGRHVGGRYGPYRLSLNFVGHTLVGRIGTAPLRCGWTETAYSFQISCTGADGGAEALIPLLAFLYVN